MSDSIGNYIGAAIQPATSGVHNLFQQFFHRTKGTWPLLSSGISATGGTISNPGDGYRYHAFTTSSSLSVSAANPFATAEILVVGAGGAGGGGWGGSGGGAGGILYSTSYPITPGTYPITIGSGATNTVQGGSGSPGTASVFNGYPAGGGIGGIGGPNPAGPAGPQGPVISYPPVGFGAIGPNPGGLKGGGGAGAAGTPTASGIGKKFPSFVEWGTMGPPVNDPSPPIIKGYFAGGGTSTPDNPGQWGGGSNSPTPAVVNTGGGGGSINDGYPNTSAPGIVLVRYIP